MITIIYVNGKLVVTDRWLVNHYDLCMFNWPYYHETKFYNVHLEVDDKFWNDIPINQSELIRLRENMRFKIFPKASYSERCPELLPDMVQFPE